MRSYSGRMSDVAEETRHRIETAGRAARAASKRLALLSRAEKDTALLTLADAVEATGLAGLVEIDKVRQFFDHPGFVAPFAEGVAAGGRCGSVLLMIPPVCVHGPSGHAGED